MADRSPCCEPGRGIESSRPSGPPLPPALPAESSPAIFAPGPPQGPDSPFLGEQCGQPPELRKQHRRWWKQSFIILTPAPSPTVSCSGAHAGVPPGGCWAAVILCRLGNTQPCLPRTGHTQLCCLCRSRNTDESFAATTAAAAGCSRSGSPCSSASTTTTIATACATPITTPDTSVSSPATLGTAAAAGEAPHVSARCFCHS